MDFKEEMDRVSEWAARKGWEPDPTRTFGDECALLHSEISEALEAYREWGFDRKAVTHNRLGQVHVATHYEYPRGAKPEGVPSEFADLFIRLLHYCAVHEIDLESEYEAKMAYNETRAYRHGNKAL